MASNDVSFNIGVSINKNSVSEVKRQIKSIQTEVTNLADKYKTAASVSANSKDSQVKEWRTDIKGANTDITNFNKTLKLYEQQLELLSAKEIELKEATKERNKTQSRLNTAQAGLENTKVAYTKGEMDADTYQAKTSSYEDKIKLETEKLEAQKAKVVELRAEYNAIKAPLKGMETTLNASYNNIKQTESSADAIFNKSGVIYKNADGTANATAKTDSNTKATASDADAVQSAFKETASAANDTATATQGVKDATKQAASSSEGAKKIKDVFKEIRDKAVDSSSSILEIVQKIAQLRSEGQDASSTVSLLNDKLGGLVAANEDAAALNYTIRDMNSALKFINADNIKSMGDVFNSLSAAIIPQKQALSELNSAIRTTGETYIQTAQQAKDAANTQAAVNQVYALTGAYQQAQQEISTAVNTIAQVNSAIQTNGLPNTIAEITRYLSYLTSATNTLKSADIPASTTASYNQAITLITQLKQKASEYQKSITNAGQASKTFGTNVKTGATTAKSALGGLPGLVNSIKSGFNNVKSASNKVQSNISGLASSVKSNFKHMLTSLTKYVLGFRSLFFLVRRLRTYIGQGIQNIVQWNDGDNEVNEAITDLLTSLLYLKNAWASAFSPIITYVRPLLVSLIDTIADVGNTIARFIGYLTGQTLVFNAVRVQAEDYADSLDDTGSSASGAADQVENLTDRLAAFDDLNVLGKDNDDNGSGSGGGGGSDDTYSPDPNDMFELVENEESTFLSLLKSSWENADFTEVGEIIKNKLIDMLTIDWENDVFPTATKIGSSLGTFLTGLLGDEALWETAGGFVAGCFNTITEAVTAFLEKTAELNWGSGLATAVNTFLEEGEIYQAATNIHDALSQIITNIESFLNDLKEEDIAQGIKDVLEGLQLIDLAVQVTGLVITATQAIIKVAAATLVSASDVVADTMTATVNAEKTVKIDGTEYKVDQPYDDDDNPLSKWFQSVEFDLGKWITLHMGGDTTFGIETLSGFITPIADFLQNMIDNAMSLIDPLGEMFTEMGQTLSEMISNIPDFFDLSSPIADVLSWITSIDGDEIMKWATPLTAVIALLNGEEMPDWATPIGAFISLLENADWEEIMKWWSPFSAIITLLTDGDPEGINNWLTPINGLITVMTDWGGVIEWLDGVLEGFREALGLTNDDLDNSNDKLSSTTETVKGNMNKFKTDLSSIWTNLISDAKSKFSDMQDKLVEVFTNLEKRIKPPINGAITVIESFVNKMLTGINSFIDKLNEMPDITLTNPFTGTNYTMGWNIPRLNYVHLPRLAQGAVIPPNKEFMAVLGDQKSGTNIEAPLDTIKQAVAEELSEQIGVLQEGFASVVHAINSKELAIGDKQIGQASARYNAQQARIRGVNW